MKPTRLASPESFTLIEVLVSMAILVLLTLVVYGVLSQTSAAWLLAENRTETYQSARLALEMMTRDLEGAVVGTNNLPPPNGRRITFLAREDANNSPSLASGDSRFLDTPPNDQIFFVANASETAGERFIDLTEYGYFVTFATTNLFSVAGPGYYLFRHQVRSHNNQGTLTTSYDIFSSPTTWYQTPGVSDSARKFPIADHVVRLELRYEKLGGTAPQGTCVLDDWTAPFGTCTAPSSPPDTLPRAVHITMSALDSRYAARVYAIVGTSGISSSELAKVPDNIDSMSSVALQNIFRQGLRNFYRTVYLRNVQ